MNKLFFLLILFSNISLAQRNCTTDDYNKHLQENNIEFNQKQQELENYTSNYINLLPLMNTTTEIHTIPVVVHILYNNTLENISDEQIQSQLDSLNKDFRAQNTDISTVPSVFEPLVADIGIEFCLATQDPDGNISTGINRVFTDNTSFSYNNNSMKFTSQGGVDVWDSQRYLNIWVCNISGSILGFAQFPGGPSATDGVVIDYEYFGSLGTASYPYDLGRTLTHEVGHWLNLRHIWGDSYCGDDFVDDTPTQEGSNGGCPTFPSVSCSNGPNGDMFMNYMDYTYDYCLTMFTTGQKNRMIAALNSSRSELLNNNLCSPYIAGCTDSIADNYNPLATANDSSCQYTCMDYQFNIATDCWGQETSWQLTKNETIIESVEAGSYDDNTEYSYDLCLIEGCYTITIFDVYGDGVSGSNYSSCSSDGDYQLTNQSNSVVFTMSDSNFGNQISYDFCSSPSIIGCTDSTQFNYDSSATVDDGSCEPFIYGCTDLTQFNYNPLANTDDGNCQPFIYGCLDETQFNYNPLANTDDGNCQPFIYGCTDSTQFNYNSLANTDDGNCEPYVYGCTDLEAENFNESANTEDGSCEYICLEHNLTISTDLFAYETSWILNKNQEIISSIPINTYSNLTTYNHSFCLTDGCYTFVISDSYGDGIEGYNNNSDDDGNYFLMDQNNNTVIEMLALNFGYQESQSFCIDIVEGCTDSTANNFNPNANLEDGSCNYITNAACDIAPTGLFVDDIIHNRVVFNWSAPSAAPSHYMIRYRALGASSWTVMTAGPVNSNEFTGTSRTRYFMEPGTTYEWSMRARVLNEDGSTNCQSSWSALNEYTTLDACANLENLSVSSEANWATLSADAPASEWGVWQSKGKLRVVGTNSFRYVNGASDGSISVLKGNFDASTDYEWHTKAWCTGNVDANGASDPMYHSGWGDFSSFSTEAPCDKMPTNLTTVAANNAQTAITMSWDTPETGAPDHYFLELTNVTTGQVWAWNNIAGSDNSKSKYGLTAGDYSWRIRGACGTNGTSWATIFSQPATYTLGGARLENSSEASLDVYPNPSRDVFNVTFKSDEVQTMTVKVVNIIGKEILVFKVNKHDGLFEKEIDLSTYSNGVYFLEVLTSKRTFNRRLILQ